VGEKGDALLREKVQLAQGRVTIGMEKNRERREGGVEGLRGGLDEKGKNGKQRAGGRKNSQKKEQL